MLKFEANALQRSDGFLANSPKILAIVLAILRISSSNAV